MCVTIEQLKNLSDTKYKLFNTKIVNTKQTLLGVRIPLLRDIAKKIIKTDPYRFIKSDKQNIYELILLEGFVISYLKDDLAVTMKLFENYLYKVDSWTEVDYPICSFKSIKSNKPFVWKIVKKWLKIDNEFIKRASLVVILTYFIDDTYIDEIFDISSKLDDSQYYVMMANAWLISMCMVKYPSKTKEFLTLKKLDKTTQKKAIQKCKYRQLRNL